MTRPRKVEPGRTYRVTRRTSGRHFYCTPIPQVRQIVGYTLALAQRLFDLDLHITTWMSNHHHTDVTDPAGVLPEAMQFLHRESAMALKALFEIDGTVWDSEHYTALEIADEGAVWHSLQYTPLNPVRARLVADYRSWPGLTWTPQHWSSPSEVFQRPLVYFNRARVDRIEETLTFTPHPWLRDRQLDALVRDASAFIDECQERVLASIQLEGETFLGVERLQQQSPFETPRTRSPRIPRSLPISAGTTAGFEESKERFGRHLERYEECMALVRGGADPRAVPWPDGTHKMRRLFAPTTGRRKGPR